MVTVSIVNEVGTPIENFAVLDAVFVHIKPAAADPLVGERLAKALPEVFKLQGDKGVKADYSVTCRLFMAYALWTYLWRARRIARREPSARYDDVAGPTTLVVVLVIVSSMAAFVAVRDAFLAR